MAMQDVKGEGSAEWREDLEDRLEARHEPLGKYQIDNYHCNYA